MFLLNATFNIQTTPPPRSCLQTNQWVQKLETHPYEGRKRVQSADDSFRGRSRSEEIRKILLLLLYYSDIIIIRKITKNITRILKKMFTMFFNP